MKFINGIAWLQVAVIGIVLQMPVQAGLSVSRTIPECHPSGSGTLAPRKYSACERPVRLASHSGCARAFEDSKDGNPWRMHGAAPSELNSSACKSMNVSCIDSVNRMAHVACYTGDGNADFFVNVENLDCVADNVASYAPRLLSMLPSGTCPVSQIETLPVALSSIENAHFVPNALQRCVVAAARKKYSEVQGKVQDQDQYKLFEIYANMKPSVLKAALMKAHEVLVARVHRAFKLFGPKCDKDPVLPKNAGVLETDIPQGQRTCKLITEAALMSDHLDADKLTAVGLQALFIQTESMNFAQSHSTATFDETALRTIMFEGLPAERQAAIFKQLNMKRMAGEFERLEKATTPFAFGTFVELHNGYVFGGSRMDGNKNSIDCSDFISSMYGLKSPIIDKNGRRVNRVPSTLQMQQIARFVSKNTKDVPPAPWDQYVSCFKSVNLRGGDRPQPGDIVVQRANGEGHVVLVESYNADSTPDSVNTIEAYGGGEGTLGPNTRPLFEPRCKNSQPEDQPALRQDITVIRFVGGSGCPAHPNEKACASED